MDVLISFAISKNILRKEKKMNYKDKINFKIKSTWFDKGVMKNIGYKGFWLYVNLYKFLLGNTNGQVLTTINLLQKETNYSKNEVIKLLRAALAYRHFLIIPKFEFYTIKF